LLCVADRVALRWIVAQFHTAALAQIVISNLDAAGRIAGFQRTTIGTLAESAIIRHEAAARMMVLAPTVNDFPKSGSSIHTMLVASESDSRTVASVR
jgi:hypothetical protein